VPLGAVRGKEGGGKKGKIEGKEKDVASLVGMYGGKRGGEGEKGSKKKKKKEGERSSITTPFLPSRGGKRRKKSGEKKGEGGTIMFLGCFSAREEKGGRLDLGEGGRGGPSTLLL